MLQVVVNLELELQLALKLRDRCFNQHRSVLGWLGVLRVEWLLGQELPQGSELHRLRLNQVVFDLILTVCRLVHVQKPFVNLLRALNLTLKHLLVLLGICYRFFEILILKFVFDELAHLLCHLSFKSINHAFEVAHVRVSARLGISHDQEVVLGCDLLFLLFDLSEHQRHLRRNLLRRLFDDLINTDLGSDLLRLRPEVESLEGLLCVLGQLRYAADDRCLRLANQGVLQDSGQLGVPEIDVVVAAGILAHRQLVDDI